MAVGASLGATAVPLEFQVRDVAGKPLADAVLAVQLAGQPGRAAAGAVAQMAQRDRRFQPHVLVVQTGTAVSFPNFDTVRHHVYSFSTTKKFDIKLYAGTPARPEIFDRPGVATLGCNIHDSMSAHIVVVDTPIYTKTDTGGAARLDLPRGTHRLYYWHPDLGTPTLREQELVVGAGTGRIELTLRPAE
ncbi:MAG: methylamine utilization protein [Burkholderiales bacterium]|nr:methylamine utilization protein [Burkholderiales bacterium]